MSFCANCGRQRNGTARFCDNCGTEFSDPAAIPGDHGAPSRDVTRTDITPDATRTDSPAAEPDPFASWYQPRAQGGTSGAAGGAADDNWQPTQTVQAAPAKPAGYPPPPAAPPTRPAPPFPPVPPATGPVRRGRKGLFAVLAAIVVLAAGGGAYAVASALGKNPGAHPGGTSSAPASGSQSTGTAPAPASTGPASSPTPSPTLSLVSIAPGVSSSAAVPQVETLLSHYFHGINTHDYAEYASTLSPAEQAKQSQSTFDSGFATTADSGMTLTSLAGSAGGGLTATVTFTSHQAPADSADNSACNDWTLNFYLIPHGTGYLIGPAPSGYQPDYSDC